MSEVWAEADAVVWVADGLVADGLDYGDRLVERLTGRGLSVVRRDLTRADVVVPTARLHILSGGATSVNERFGWMPHGLALTRSLVEAARRGDHTVVGVCLGAQVIAEALWSGAVHATERIEVGLTEVQWAGQDVERIVVPTFHYEQLSRPAVVGGGGEVVAVNANSLVEGFRLGARVWGLQFHLELEPGDVQRLVMHHRQTIEAQGGTAAAALQSVDQLESRWSSDLFDRIFNHIVEC